MEINFYQEMASEHRLQEYSKGTVPLCVFIMLAFIDFFSEIGSQTNMLERKKLKSRSPRVFFTYVL